MRLFPTAAPGDTLNTMGLDVSIPQSVIQTSQPTLRTSLFSWGRVDLRNICLLLAGFALILLVIPPGRSYPMSDDWAYAQSVERLLNLNYYPHDWAQPTSLGHLIWGVVASILFGYNFTALTIATLLVSACCLVAFYTLLRQLNVATTPAILGTALLGLNPMYVYLSYSFMTDITFMLYLLVACLCFARWAQGSSNRWLILGSIATALAYLTRQHGIVLLPAMLFFLWYARRLNWRNVLTLCAIPVLTVAVYMIWERTQPTQLVSNLVSQATREVLSDPLGFVWSQLMRSTLVLALPGLCLLPLIAYIRPKKLIFTAIVWLAFVFFLLRGLTLFGTMFPAFGGLVDHTGYPLYGYAAEPIWSEQVWSVIGIAGAFVLSLYITGAAPSLVQWLREVRNQQSAIRNTPDPAIIAYATGLLLAVITFASPFLFDRYILPLLPIIMIFPLKRMSKSFEPQLQTMGDDPTQMPVVPPERTRVAFVLILPIALFSLLAIRDYREHSGARWQAAEQLVAKGIPYEQVSAGFEWSSWYLFDKGVEYIRTTGEIKYSGLPYEAVLDPVYVLGDIQQNGYREIDSIDYKCWLCGGTTRRILVQQRQTP